MIEGEVMTSTLNRIFLFFSLYSIIIFSPSISHASFMVAQYNRFIISEPKFRDYLIGLGRGYFWASVHTDIYWERKIFCLPSGFILTGDEIIKTIDFEVRKKKYTPDMQLEPIVAWAFINRFPCK